MSKQEAYGYIIICAGAALFYLYSNQIKDPDEAVLEKTWEAEEQEEREQMDKEYALERQSLQETLALAQHGTPRTMPITEAAFMTRHLDVVAEETGQPRFTTITPFPEVSHRMPNHEKILMVNKELFRLRTLQRAVKDNIDIWYKDGALGGPRFVDPLNTWQMISGDEAIQQNDKILDEIDRLEEFKGDLLADTPWKYHVMDDKVITTWPEGFVRPNT